MTQQEEGGMGVGDRLAMARSADSNMVCGYGVKLLPNWKSLERFSVPEAQREILRFYGYPGKQWWQKVVDPGLV